MTPSVRRCRWLLAFALLAPPLALACGEGMFNTGKGLPYQSYLAPRPAAVLVYADAARSLPARDESVYAGLKKAGHRVTVVRDPQSLKQAMREARYDVVISALDDVEAVTAAEAEQPPALLPVVARAVRDTPQVKNRFELFLLDGASLGQYLRAINKLVGVKG